MRFTRRVLAGAVLAGAFAATTSAWAEEILIGVQIPLSGPVAAVAGERAKTGVDIAIEKINSSGMLGPGRTVRAVIEDNAGDKTQAITVANKLMRNQDVIAMVGVFGSGLSVPVAPIANDLKTPFIAVASSPAIVGAGPWNFCLFYPSEAQVTITSDLAVNKLKVKSMSIVFDKTNDGSVRMKNALEESLKASGVKVLSADGITPADTNFGPLSTKIASLNPEAVYVESNPAVGANVFVQLRQAGINPNVKFLGAPQMNSPALTQIGGAAVEGLYMPTPYHAGMPSEENKAFVAEFNKRIGSNPGLPAGAFYASVMLVAHALREAGPNADREKVRDALAKLKNVSVPIGQGVYSFNADRFGDYQDGLVQIKDGAPQYTTLN